LSALAIHIVCYYVSDDQIVYIHILVIFVFLVKEFSISNQKLEKLILVKMSRMPKYPLGLMAVWLGLPIAIIILNITFIVVTIMDDEYHGGSYGNGKCDVTCFHNYFILANIGMFTNN